MIQHLVLLRNWKVISPIKSYEGLALKQFADVFMSPETTEVAIQACDLPMHIIFGGSSANTLDEGRERIQENSTERKQGNQRVFHLLLFQLNTTL